MAIPIAASGDKNSDARVHDYCGTAAITKAVTAIGSRMPTGAAPAGGFSRRRRSNNDPQSEGDRDKNFHGGSPVRGTSAILARHLGDYKRGTGSFAIRSRQILRLS